MYSEEDFVMLSGLQHLLFCERQCYLIHAEQIWADNYFTAAGEIMHERVDRCETAGCGGDKKIARALAIRSVELGLSGKADVVEFHRLPDGKWQPFPVEYKLGKPKIDDSDRVQLCAQGMCLEDMLDTAVPAGALFYGRTRRREEVVFNASLRRMVRDAALRLHELLAADNAPPAQFERKKCGACSLRDYCLPQAVAGTGAGNKYLDAVLDELLAPNN